MESSFTDEEKRFVLAEMVKYSNIDVNTLVEFVRHHEIQPEWMYFHLPRGRNMNECVHAAEVMFNNSHIAPPAFSVASPLKRRSFSDISVNEHGAKRQAMASPGELSPYSFPRGANVQVAAASHQQHPVNIKPRPNGYPSTNHPPPPPLSAPTIVPTTRRRGRPPKAESSRQNPAQIRIMPYQPITPAPAPTPILPSPGPTMAPQPHSPPPGSHSAYRISPGASFPDPQPKRKGRQSGGERYSPPETVPRTIQGAAPSHEEGSRHQHQQQQLVASESDYRADWRDSPQHQREEQVRNSGPILLEPPLTPHGNPSHRHPPLSPHQPLSPHPPPSPGYQPIGAGMQSREGMATTAANQPHREGQVAVSSA